MAMVMVMVMVAVMVMVMLMVAVMVMVMAMKGCGYGYCYVVCSGFCYVFILIMIMVMALGIVIVILFATYGYWLVDFPYHNHTLNPSHSFINPGTKSVGNASKQTDAEMDLHHSWSRHDSPNPVGPSSCDGPDNRNFS